MDHETIELACIGLGALALLMQSIILLAIYMGVNKATKKVQEDLDELRLKVIPIVDSTRGTLERVTPQLESTVADIAELARGLRAQAADIEVAVDQIVSRVQKQSSRIDTMFSGTLDAVDKASVFVAETVSKPVRQLSGLLASVKAIVESLRASETGFHAPKTHDDKDMFV